MIRRRFQLAIPVLSVALMTGAAWYFRQPAPEAGTAVAVEHQISPVVSSRVIEAPTFPSKPLINRSSYYLSRSAAPRVAAVEETPEAYAENGPITESVAPNAITNWAATLTNILAADQLPLQKAAELLDLVPQFPPEGRAEVAQRLGELVRDEDYPLLGDRLIDPATPQDMQDLLLEDLLNRSGGAKLPWLVEIAKQPDHPKAALAREHLQQYLTVDYGEEWAQWRSQAIAWLQQ